MFYPESALVKRTPGIATVWLMATLGARQHSKRVSKQAILQVNIPQACDAVHNPQAPMALRLQSNLLYGISRVYSQKCVYILTDAEAAQVALKNLFRHVQISELDPRAGRARPETLVVPDDPSFVPDLHFHVIDFDVSTFDSSGASFLTSSDVSGLSHVSSQSNRSLHNSEPPQLEISLSDSFSGGLEVNLPRPDIGSVRGRLSLEIENTELYDDIGFEFDAAGNMVEDEMLDVVPQAEALPDVSIPQQNAPQSGEHIPEIAASDLQHPTDDGFLSVDDLDTQIHESIEQDAITEEHPSTNISANSEYIEAPQIRRKKRPELPRDATLQILNTELLQWQNDYVTNMQNAKRLKDLRQQARRVKLNARLVLLGADHSGSPSAITLLNFRRHLFGQLTGSSVEDTATKRKRKQRASFSEGESSGSEARRTRLHVDEEEENLRSELENERGFTALVDDIEHSIELARDAMTIMEDHSTQLQLPWSVSRAGSIRSARMSRQASILSNRAIGSITGNRAASIHSFDRRTSRLPTASPAIGRADMIIADNHVTGTQDGLNDDGFLPDFGSGPGTSPYRQGASTQDFELFGPAAEVSTQEAADSQWLRSALNKESKQFLAWIQNSVNAKKEDGSVGSVNDSGSIRFDELLPADKHSCIVAAQGFLHTLLLANKGLINVSQEVNNEDGDDLLWAPLKITIAEGQPGSMIEI